MDNDVALPAQPRARVTPDRDSRRVIKPPLDDARRRALERQRRAEAARIAALVQSMLHGRSGEAGVD